MRVWSQLIMNDNSKEFTDQWPRSYSCLKYYLIQPFLSQLTCLDDKLKVMKMALADSFGYLPTATSLHILD